MIKNELCNTTLVVSTLKWKDKQSAQYYDP